MQQTQIVAHGIAGPLADGLRTLAQTRRVWLRETSQLDACRNLVQSSLPPILVIVLGRDLAAELTLIEQAHATSPGTAILVIVEADNPTLAGLAWDLGAAFVHAPPMSVELIDEVVLRLLAGETT